MKKNPFLRRTLCGVFGLVSLLGAGSALTGCTEDIDESNYAIAEEQTVTDFLSTTDSLSKIKAIFDRVRLGDDEQASSLTSVLSARGNYTLFVPSNAAVDAYIASLGVASVDSLSYEQAQLIANSCIIDNGTQAAYETADFPTPGTFPISNLNDRLLSCELDTAVGASDYLINGESRVVSSDHEVSNGMIHIVSSVIAPSSDLLPDMIAAAPNMKIMSYLLTQTHLCDSLLEERDDSYEEERSDDQYRTGTGEVLYQPDHRYLGFTGFVETDDVYAREWGINLQTDAEGNVTNWDEVMSIIEDRCADIYSSGDDAALTAAAAGDLTNPDNAVNRFVAYHFIKGRKGYDRLVRHCNEYNYRIGDWNNPQTANCPTDVWDYYATVGKYRGLVKVVQSGDAGPYGDPDHKIYVNRFPVYNDGFDGDYSVVSVAEEGILISATNGEYDNNAQNGFYYPINNILSYDRTTRERLGGERMRMDFTTFLPELSSNNIRGVSINYFTNDYFENIITASAGTTIYYLYTRSNASWRDYQGDEMQLEGLFDATFRLPPVPMDGTYEIRLGVSLNGMRGMGQFYFGSDPLRLGPVGLPIDMRQSMQNNPAIPAVADVEDEQTNIENDRNMRNQGWMKAPQYATICNGNGDSPLRAQITGNGVCRAILSVEDMKANQTYYLRMKSALRKTDAQFFLDYIEYVPTSVYNGVQPEDIW